MREYRQYNPISVYFLTDAKIIRDENVVMDITDARKIFTKLVNKAMCQNDRGRVIMKFASGDIVQSTRVIPLGVDIVEFNKTFGKL